MKWRIGCSGFHYKEWKGIFYPESVPQNEWFRFYTERFQTIELNVTFYRFPVLKSLINWYNISPANFRFAVKVPRLITHYKKFRDCDRLLKDFYSLAKDGLREKLGPVLFQLPPQMIYSKEQIDLITGSINKNFHNVIEFRNASWWRPVLFNRLKKEKITFCGIDYPGLPNDPVITNNLIYYRFHGQPRLYYSAYKQPEMKKVADTIMKGNKPGNVFVFFNNTATRAAIRNATWFKKYTGT